MCLAMNKKETKSGIQKLRNEKYLLVFVSLGPQNRKKIHIQESGVCFEVKKMIHAFKSSGANN